MAGIFSRKITKTGLTVPYNQDMIMTYKSSSEIWSLERRTASFAYAPFFMPAYPSLSFGGGADTE